MIRPGQLVEFTTGVAVVGGLMWGTYQVGVAVVSSGVVPSGVVTAAAVALAVVAVGRKVAGRYGVGHGHGHGQALLQHEGGHLAAAEAIGARVRHARVGGGEGVVSLADPEALSPQDYMTFMLAGRYAAGTGAGCGGDNASVAAERKRLRAQGMTSGQVRRVEQRAHTAARRIARSGRVAYFADRLARHGRI